MNEPLNQFADRLIRNNEIETFIDGLLAKGVPPERIKQAVDNSMHDASLVASISKAFQGRHHN